ncbi:MULTISPECIES: ferrochelatase [unclassified Beijerinckia]|uniref:ferrochelatase n=1 Tax=unclassified Beijerinckia TaxID=2638183 RepID=UPI00089BE05F|nr:MULTISPECIES: ferrochelatase [unclassified Beijerinckia]MDH7798779.1 ferrochelatase [Beijerinckia sp. GAS462]SED32913.1 ferrochelatase [Beijerinckia sp. 28-YEA-48]
MTGASASGASNQSPGRPSGKVGVLIVNLGTPDATDYWSMRRYLKEFLSDPRVIEVPRLLWWPILNLVILTIRPGLSGRKYAAIWNRERNESPLRTYTRAQAERLSRMVDDGALGDGGLGDPARPVVVDWGMRYGDPSIRSRLEALQAQGCDRILCVPLYPQYAASASATVADKAFAALKAMRWQPAVRIAPPWPDDPVYIEALAQSMRDAVAKLDFEPQAIIASFHGIPQSYADKGDPYALQCALTAQKLRQQLGFNEEQMPLAYQSRFGRTEWIKPYLDATVRDMAKRGIKRIAVIAPGFVSDCVETIEEIGIEVRDAFLAEGGEKYARIACLNDSDAGMNVLAHVVKRELQGWI